MRGIAKEAKEEKARAQADFRFSLILDRPLFPFSHLNANPFLVFIKILLTSSVSIHRQDMLAKKTQKQKEPQKRHLPLVMPVPDSCALSFLILFACKKHRQHLDSATASQALSAVNSAQNYFVSSPS